MTESGPTVSSLGREQHKVVDRPPEEQKILASAGQPALGVHARIVDDKGNDVEPGEIGEITASGNNCSASMIAAVIKERLLYPEDMEFSPRKISVKSEGSGHAKLFINTGKIPVGSVISLDVDSADIILEESEILLDQSHVRHEDIALVKIDFISGSKSTAHLFASSGEHQAEAEIRIADQQDEPRQPTSKFKGWKFIEVEPRRQCFYDNQQKSPNSGYLMVNKNNPINQLYFGQNPSRESVSGSALSMAYLADILTNEALSYMFHEKWKTVKREGGDPLAEKDPYLYIRNELDQEIARIGPQIHELFVDPNLLRGLVKMDAE